MKQTYIDFIEKTVREHCKELQELSVGCKVKADYKFIGKVIHGFEGVFICKIGNKVNCLLKDGYLGAVESYEILGHEIHLEHILRTMGENWAINANGKFLEYVGSGEYGPTTNDRVFDLSLSWKDQDISWLKFCAETMGFNQ